MYHSSIIILLESFSNQFKQRVFYRCLSDSKSSQLFRTLLSILVDFNNALCLYGLDSPNPISKLLLTVPSAPLQFVYPSFSRSTDFIALWTCFSTSLSFHFFIPPPIVACWDEKIYFTAPSHFFCCWLSLYVVLLQWLGHPFVSQNHSEIYASHFQGQILVSEFVTCSYGQTLFFCTIPSRSSSPTISV